MNVSPSNVSLKITFASCAPALSVRLLAIVVAISAVCVISVLSVLRFMFSFYYKGGLIWFEPKTIVDKLYNLEYYGRQLRRT